MVTQGTAPDHEQAQKLSDARQSILANGAKDLEPRPWQHPSQPPSHLELVQLAAWAARIPEAEPESLLAALSVLSEARAELDSIEAALLFAARAGGSTFPQLAGALGLRSAQAAQQRMTRVQTRAAGATE